MLTLLARLPACPAGYVLCFCLFSLFFIYFTDPNSWQVISEYSRPIFTKFSRLVDVRRGTWLAVHSFWDRSRNVLPWQPIFGTKSTKLALPHLRSAHWRSETDYRIAIPISEDQMVTISLHVPDLTKFLFDEIRSSNPGVYDLRMCTNNRRRSLMELVSQRLLGAALALLGRAGYTLGFSTHF